jgi:8-oxo-dGTP diphosphatase
MIYRRKPMRFSPRFEVAGCFVEREGKLLLLHRRDDRPQGNTWGVPAGKLTRAETPEEAMRRELWEETGIDVHDRDLRAVKTVFVRYAEYDFLFHVFSVSVPAEVSVTLRSEEHKNFRWVTPLGALGLRLIPDLAKCIELWGPKPRNWTPKCCTEPRRSPRAGGATVSSANSSH